MANKANSLAHTKWMCKYHIVFTPKYRRKIIYNQYKESIRDILKQLCDYKGVEIIEGHIMPDHVHMLVSIPPKLSVSQFMGYLKGKSRSWNVRWWDSLVPAYLFEEGEHYMTREEAWNLLTEYNKDKFHLEHAEIVEQTMRYFALKLGYIEEVDFWGIVGLLHDLDFECYPEQHCIKEQEIMRNRGIDEKIIHATASHGYGITVDIEPKHEMEKVLYAVDELTGLIGAVTLMRPSKSVQDLELKSVKKKYKNRNFAAGCSREVIERGAEMLGWDLDDLIVQTIEALRTFRE